MSILGILDGFADDIGVVLRRQVRDGHHGWTVELRDDADHYELNGCDYVLDLISEVEVSRPVRASCV